MDPGNGMFRRRCRSVVATLAQAYERAVAPLIGSMLACAIAALLVETCSIARSSPSRRAPIRIVCTLLGRWPTPVNISGRVRTSLTGRPTARGEDGEDHVL